MFCIICRQQLQEIPVYIPCQFSCVADISCVIINQSRLSCPNGHFLTDEVENGILFSNTTKLNLMNHLKSNVNTNKKECQICYELVPSCQLLSIGVNCEHKYCIKCTFYWIIQSI